MRKSIVLGAAAALLLAAPAAAQDYNAAVGFGGGYMLFGDLNPDGGEQEVSMESGWVATAHFERWYGSRRVGWKIGGGFTERPLMLENLKIGDIRLWMGDLTLALRPLAGTQPRPVAPFVTGGVGVMSWQLGEGPRVPIVGADAQYDGDSETQFAVTFGGGFDIFTGLTWDEQPLGLRLEAANHMALSSPFKALDGSDYGPIHNIRVSASIFTGMDWLTQ